MNCREYIVKYKARSVNRTREEIGTSGYEPIIIRFHLYYSGS